MQNQINKRKFDIMKILQINCVYGVGSTGKITKDIHTALLDRGYESVVIYGRGKKTDDTNVFRIGGDIYGKANNLLSRFTGIMYGGCFLSTKAIIKKIKKENPDIVHLQCINGYFCNIFKLLRFLKESKIQTVLTLHAEFMYTGNCGYAGTCDKWISGCSSCSRLISETKSLLFDRTGYSWNKFHQLYKNWEELTVVACSEWIASRAKMSGEIKNRRIEVLHNGIDNENVFYKRPYARDLIFEKYNISRDKKAILFIAPEFSYLKGFDLFLRLADVCQDLPFQFVCIGEEISDCKNNVTSIGRVLDQNKLAEFYSACDVLVMCSRNENYPTVCLEASSCATPVVGFDVGGVKETIPDGMGKVVEPENIYAMREALEKIAFMNISEETENHAVELHSKTRMINDYIELYKSLLKEG